MTMLNMMIKVIEADIVLLLVLGIWLFLDELKYGIKEEDENDNDPEEF